MYYIYCHTFPNGKRYVGITRTSPKRRWGDGRNYVTCPLVYRAIQKYGWGNVTHEIIDTAESKEDAENKERYYILCTKHLTYTRCCARMINVKTDTLCGALLRELRVRTVMRHFYFFWKGVHLR